MLHSIRTSMAAVLLLTAACGQPPQDAVDSTNGVEAQDTTVAGAHDSESAGHGHAAEGEGNAPGGRGRAVFFGYDFSRADFNSNHRLKANIIQAWPQRR